MIVLSTVLDAKQSSPHRQNQSRTSTESIFNIVLDAISRSQSVPVEDHMSKTIERHRKASFLYSFRQF